MNISASADLQLDKFKTKKQSNDEYYNNRRLDIDFKIKNRLNAKIYYDSNRDYINAKNLCNYYLKNDKLDIFKIRHRDRYDLLFLGHT
tara:strand:- start:670 stop:933 length:264 start_codon:yes stop_codon:yes gene_type:complete